MAAIDGTEYRELFQLFATRSEFAQIQQMLGAISVKLDSIVPRDTHDHIWKADQEWKNGARSEMNDIVKELDAIKGLIAEINEGTSGWPKKVRDDIEDIRAQRIPQWLIIFLGWIIPGLVMYTLMHMH